MWKVIQDSATGTSHKKLNSECQDYSGFKTLSINGAPAIAACISDGAGSALHSRLGSSLAVEYALSQIQSTYSDWKPFDKDWATSLIEETIQYLNEMSTQQNISIKDFACTFLFCIFTADTSRFLQIGDGCWVVGNKDRIFAPTWPSSGEYANETTFLTSINFVDSFQYTEVQEPIEYVAGFSDGLQNLLLDFAGKKPFEGFFNPFISSIKAVNDPNILKTQLSAFLESDRINSRTDDDKTLLFVWRDM